MKWIKKGVIFRPDNNFDWMISHASIPFVDPIDDEVFRIYFGTRDSQGRSHPAYIDVSASDPQQILYVHDRPVLPLGDLGTFDDNGIMPSWIVSDGFTKYLYYIGWNPQVTVSYRLSIGLAVSQDGGETYEKYSVGPICDRSIDEPYFNTAPCVLLEDGKWRMWYVSCTSWEVTDDWPEPLYNVKYAESPDGIHWAKSGQTCIDYDENSDAIGRPCVWVEDDLYKMLYSYRQLAGYRTDPANSYRLGYAESHDGLSWIRMDGKAGISRSEAGWDSKMMEYCYTLIHKGRRYLFYNGNGFGRSGLGYAVLTS